MSADLCLKLEVPVIVRVGQRAMRLSEILALVPGSIVELPKSAEDELDLLVNNKPVATGTAVKVGENFGIRLSYVGDPGTRIEAIEAPGMSNSELEALAASMLTGQV